MKYELGIYRTVYQSDTLFIEAASEDEAHVKALERAHNTVFGDGNVEYEVETYDVKEN